MKTSSTLTSRHWLYNTLRTLASHYGHTAVDHTHLFAPAQNDSAAKAVATARAVVPATAATCACSGAA